MLHTFMFFSSYIMLPGESRASRVSLFLRLVFMFTNTEDDNQPERSQGTVGVNGVRHIQTAQKASKHDLSHRRALLCQGSHDR